MSEDDWFYADVRYVLENGLISGTETDKFSPNTNLTRGMLVTILYRYAGEPNIDGENPFADVSGGKYYTDAVTWASLIGLVSGYGNGTFGAEDSITREQLAVILYRFAQLMGFKLPVMREYTGFNDDADIANYAKEAIEAFFKAGIVSGRPGEIFDPKATATRAEIAAILRRFLELVEEFE